MADAEIALILAGAVARAGSLQAVANALGRSRQWLSRVLKKQTSVGPAVVVRLARLEHLPVLDLLRKAGHGELADELEAAGFGDNAVSKDDHALLRALSAWEPEQARRLRALILHRSPNTKRERKR